MQRYFTVEVKPGNPVAITLESNLHLTQVSLDAKATSQDRSSLLLSFGEQNSTLGSCRLGSIEQFPLDLVLDEGEEVTFSCTGSNSLHIFGYNIYLEDDGDMFDDEDDEEMEELEEDEEEEEEIEQPKPKGKKNQNNNQSPQQKQNAQSPQQKQNEQKKRKLEQDEAAAKKQKLQQEQQQKQQQQEQVRKQQEEQKKRQAEQKQQEREEREAKAKTPPNTLVIEDLVLGNGPEAKPGKTVSVKYVGRLAKNGKQFDSALNVPFTFKLGKGEVIQGWDKGVKGMKVGGRRKLIIPPALGYGKRASGPIPPNSTLEFEVQLVRA